MCETVAATGGSVTLCIEYLRALKREPNAAAEDEPIYTNDGDIAGYTPAGPASAAPDVAEIQRLSDELAAMMLLVHGETQRYRDLASIRNILLAKLAPGASNEK
jgi:hypothetical protein